MDLRPVLPLREAVGNHLHRGNRSVVEARIAGNLSGYALAFVAQHVADTLQFENNSVDLLHRSPRYIRHQVVEMIGPRAGGRRAVVLRAPGRDIAADEFADLAFKGRNIAPVDR